MHHPVHHHQPQPAQQPHVPTCNEIDLLRRLQAVDHRQDTVTAGSRALLLFARSKGKGIAIWHQQVCQAAQSNQAERLLGLLYVANDVLLSTGTHDNWPEFFSGCISAALGIAVSSCRRLGQNQLLDRMARLPGIWRERRIFQPELCDALAGLFVHHMQKQQPGAAVPQQAPMHGPSKSPHLASHVSVSVAGMGAPALPPPAGPPPPAASAAPAATLVLQRQPVTNAAATAGEATKLLLALKKQEQDTELGECERQNDVECKNLMEIQQNKVRLCRDPAERPAIQRSNAEQWTAIKKDHNDALEVLRMRFASQMEHWRRVVHGYMEGLGKLPDPKPAMEALTRSCRRAKDCPDTARALVFMINQTDPSTAAAQLNSALAMLANRPPTSPAQPAAPGSLQARAATQHPQNQLQQQHQAPPHQRQNPHLTPPQLPSQQHPPPQQHPAQHPPQHPPQHQPPHPHPQQHRTAPQPQHQPPAPHQQQHQTPSQRLPQQHQPSPQLLPHPGQVPLARPLPPPPPPPSHVAPPPMSLPSRNQHLSPAHHPPHPGSRAQSLFPNHTPACPGPQHAARPPQLQPHPTTFGNILKPLQAQQRQQQQQQRQQQQQQQQQRGFCGQREKPDDQRVRVNTLMGALDQLKSKLGPHREQDVTRRAPASMRPQPTAAHPHSAKPIAPTARYPAPAVHAHAKASAPQSKEKEGEEAAERSGSARPMRRSAMEPSFECELCSKSFRVRFYANEDVARMARDQHVKAAHGVAAALEGQGQAGRAVHAGASEGGRESESEDMDVDPPSQSVPAGPGGGGGGSTAVSHVSVAGGVGSDAMFIPASQVIQQGSGKLEGYVLKVGAKGLGYYKIVRAAATYVADEGVKGEGPKPEKTAEEKGRDRNRKSLGDIIKNRQRLADEESKAMIQSTAENAGAEPEPEKPKDAQTDEQVSGIEPAKDGDESDEMELELYGTEPRAPKGDAPAAQRSSAAQPSQPMLISTYMSEAEEAEEEMETDDDDDDLEEGEVRDGPRRRRPKVKVVQASATPLCQPQPSTGSPSSQQAARVSRDAASSSSSEEARPAQAVAEATAADAMGAAWDVVGWQPSEGAAEDTQAEAARQGRVGVEEKPAIQLPVTVGATEVLALGELSCDPANYFINKVVFPIGFRSARMYTSLHNKKQKVRHVSEILPGPEFVVRVEADPPYEYRGSTPTQPWLHVNTALRKRHSLRVNANVSGLTMFGFANNRILNMVANLPGYHHYEKALRQASPPQLSGKKGRKPAVGAAHESVAASVEAAASVPEAADDSAELLEATPTAEAGEEVLDVSVDRGEGDGETDIILGEEAGVPAVSAAKAEGKEEESLEDSKEEDKEEEATSDKDDEHAGSRTALPTTRLRSRAALGVESAAAAAAAAAAAEKGGADSARFTRQEIKAGQGLLDLFEYYSIAEMQAREPAPPAPLEEGMRVKAKWLAADGGVVWYDGMVQHANADGTADVVYDDGDLEQGVQRRHVQVMKRSERKRRAAEDADGQGGKRKKVASAPAGVEKGPKAESAERNQSKECGWKAEVEARVSEEVLKFMQRSMALSALPPPNPTDPLGECLAIVNVVVGSKAAEGLLESTPALRRLVRNPGKNKAPLDLGSVAQKLEKRGKGHAARYGYKTPQQVREDVIRVLWYVRDTHGEKSAEWGRAQKLMAACTALFRARIVPGLHQGMESFEHGYHWLGHRARVYWEDDMVWYSACIDDYDGAEKYHLIYDDDGIEEWMELPSADVHLIPLEWEAPINGRLLQSGDIALCSPDPASSLLYHAEIEDVDAEVGSVFVKFSNWHGHEGSWVVPDYPRFHLSDDSPLAHMANGVCFCIGDNENVRAMAKRLGVDEMKLLLLNKLSYPDLALTSKLRKGTGLVLPLDEVCRRMTWPEHGRESAGAAEAAAIDLTASPPCEVDVPKSETAQPPAIKEEPDLGRENKDPGQNKEERMEVEEETVVVEEKKMEIEEEPAADNAAPAPWWEAEQLEPLARSRREEERGGVVTMRHRKMTGETFGRVAVRAGADEKLLGAVVVVDCVGSRHLGVVSCFHPGRGEYRVKLDCEWVSPHLGGACSDGGVWTPMPSPDVSVVAEPSWKFDEEWLEERAREPAAGVDLKKGKEGAAKKGKEGAATAKGEAAARSTGTAALGVDEMDVLEVVQEHDCQMDVVGMQVVREFDQMVGTIATIIPGGDVVVVEWDDGDCEDMHLSDMIERGMVDP